MSRAARTILALAAVGALVGGAEWWKGRGREAVVPPPAGPGLPRVVDLGAKSCVPCRRMAPILADLKREYAGRADVVFIDSPTPSARPPARRACWRGSRSCGS
jgi:thioredoxin 1